MIQQIGVFAVLTPLLYLTVFFDLKYFRIPNMLVLAILAVFLVGVAPFAKDSGQYRGRRSIRSGRASVRIALYLAAMTASRFNPKMRAVYQRLRESGKPPKLAFIAVARKLLVALNAIARERRAWQP